jgi:hypothetical protein
MEVQRSMRFKVSRQEYKQNEIKGYGKMMKRIMEGQMPQWGEQSSMLEEILTSVSDLLRKQRE